MLTAHYGLLLDSAAIHSFWTTPPSLYREHEFYGMEYAFGQLGSAVQSVPHHILCSSSPAEYGKLRSP